MNEDKTIDQVVTEIIKELQGMMHVAFISIDSQTITGLAPEQVAENEVIKKAILRIRGIHPSPLVRKITGHANTHTTLQTRIDAHNRAFVPEDQRPPRPRGKAVYLAEAMDSLMYSYLAYEEGMKDDGLH